MSDLVERLREDARGGYAYNELSDEAADEIERLEEQCRGLAQSAMDNGEELLRFEADNERLEADNARLTAALREIAGEPIKPGDAYWFRERARAALEQKQ